MSDCRVEADGWRRVGYAHHACLELVEVVGHSPTYNLVPASSLSDLKNRSENSAGRGQISLVLQVNSRSIDQKSGGIWTGQADLQPISFKPGRLLTQLGGWNERYCEIENLKNMIVVIREQNVLLDSDVAKIYGVETKRINEAVRNNPDKFPDGYIIELDKNEWDALKSKFSSSMKGGKVKLPSAFTEKGLYMLATILKSTVATRATILIVETFTKIRELSRNVKELSAMQDKASQKSLMHRSGELIAEILDDDLQSSDAETSIELNFAVLKFKHTIKKKRTK